MSQSLISKQMEQAVSDHVFPGAVLLCGISGDIIFHEAFGMADIYEKRKMEKDSIFDLASLTKPLATTLAISKLIEQKKLSVTQTIGTLIDGFRQTSKAEITIDMLLRHTSGLPAHREYFKQIVKAAQDPQRFLRQLLIEEPLENLPGKCEVYSDLGFMILAWVIETISGQRLDQFVFEQVYAPLGIHDLFFPKQVSGNPFPISERKRIVSTQNCPWRRKLLKGEVDDDNAWSVGGVEGHAGLFGNAGAVFQLCCELLDAIQGRPTKVLAAGIIRELVKKKFPFGRVAGFDTPSPENSSAGRFFSKSAIGHLGFTGTSFWIDPRVSLVIILLTNRVHPSRSNTKIRFFRPQIHDLIYTQFV